MAEDNDLRSIQMGLPMEDYIMCDRVMIAAPKSGSGKTFITCALLRALKSGGRSVKAFKCGPDYIDPMFHRDVLGVPSKNLDTFFTGEEGTRALFEEGARGADIAVMEGVMGLFDGLGGINEEGSSYHLAAVTDTPIVLVVDAKGMGRSVIALIAGFLKYDERKLIKGVILNRTSGSLFEILRPVMEEELGIRALGFLAERKEAAIESRHLGLMMPGEIADLKKKLGAAAAEFEKNVDLKGLLEIAHSAPDMECVEKLNEDKTYGHMAEGPVIAVARDEAFCFLYGENLELLKKAGARLRFFSPLHDKKMPEESRGLLLCGGYPELFLEELSGNKEMLEEIKRAYASGMPTLAECGGFMYLHRAIRDGRGKSYPMVGALDAECFFTGRLVRFGYIELREKSPRFLPEGKIIRGHEFHYFDSEFNGDACIASKPSLKGREYECVIADGNSFVGFAHLYYPSNPDFAEKFVNML